MGNWHFKLKETLYQNKNIEKKASKKKRMSWVAHVNDVLEGYEQGAFSLAYSSQPGELALS